MMEQYLLVILWLFSLPCLGIKSPSEHGRSDQIMTASIEFGLPYDLANTLENPLGRSMTALSLLGVAVAFIVGLVQTALLHEQGRSDFGPRLRTSPGGSRRGPFVAPPPGLGRKRRSVTWSELPGLLDLDHGFTFLQVEGTSCRRKLVCELHSLLLSCPTWMRTVARVVTRRLALGQYRLAAKKGFSGKDCREVYVKCRRNNLEILSRLWPNVFKRKNSPYNK